MGLKTKPCGRIQKGRAKVHAAPGRETEGQGQRRVIIASVPKGLRTWRARGSTTTRRPSRKYQSRRLHTERGGFNRQGRAHSHRSDPGMGEAGARRVDGGCRDQGRKDFSKSEPDRKGLGQSNFPECGLVRGKGCCEKAGLERIAPHDLRRTCAKLCHSSGGEIEQIQFLLGHASVQTTERYLGCKQNLGHPVNDRFNLAIVAVASAEQPQSESMQATRAGDTIRRGD